MAVWRRSLAMSSKVLVGIDAQDGVLAEPVAQELQRADRGRRVGGRELALEHRRAEALLLAQAVVEHGLRIAFAADAILLLAEGEIVGEGHGIAHAPAEEIVERAAGGLAAQVPQRHLDRAERPDAGEVDIGVNATPGRQAEPLTGGDVESVLPDQARREAIEDGGGIGGRGPFAEADEAVRGLDLDDGLGEAGERAIGPEIGRFQRDVHRGRADGGDLHAALISSI